MTLQNREIIKEFVKETKGNYSPWKIKNGFGMKDYYNFYKQECKKNKINFISYTNFSKLVWNVNNQVRIKIINTGEDIYFPYKFGSIKIKKLKPKLLIDENNKLVTSYPIDFMETNRLWYLNPDAKKNKIIVRHLNKHTNGYRFKISWVKKGVQFKNSTFFYFKINRQLKRALAVSITNGQIDAQLAYMDNG